MALSTALVLLALALALVLVGAPAGRRIRARHRGLRPRVRRPGGAPLRGRVADQPADRDRDGGAHGAGGAGHRGRRAAAPTGPAGDPGAPGAGHCRASCCDGTSAGRWRCRRWPAGWWSAGSGPGWFDAAYGQGLLALVLTAGTVVAVVLGARTAARGERARTAVEDRERLQFLLDGTPVGIFEADADGRRRYVNRRWRELTGVIHDVEGGRRGRRLGIGGAPRRPRPGGCRAGSRRWSTAGSTSAATATYVRTAPSAGSTPTPPRSAPPTAA